MRAILIIGLVFVMILTMLDILANKLNKDYIILNKKLGDQNALLKKTTLFIRSQLFLTTLKECPEEEKETIVKETIDLIDEIEKVW